MVASVVVNAKNRHSAFFLVSVVCMVFSSTIQKRPACLLALRGGGMGAIVEVYPCM